MPRLVWDKVGERVYESGLDRGVLYLPGCIAVPWNGITSIIEKNEKDISPVYFDGMKINDFVKLGDFQATMKAVTYPDEFIECEGLGKIRNGGFLGDQKPKTFAICYRTQVGDDLRGDTVGYKIHIVYNVIAIPHDKTFASISQDPSLVEFEWDIYAVSVDVSGFNPTAHIIIDSRNFDPLLLEQVETILYGSQFESACLIPMEDLVDLIKTWCRFIVTDNEDGTYTVTSSFPGGIVFSGTEEEIFELLGIYVVYHDDVTYTIANTCDISDIPQIKIINNGDGTWTATTAHDALFDVEPDGFFQIFNANAIFVGPDKYQLSDTT